MFNRKKFKIENWDPFFFVLLFSVFWNRDITFVWKYWPQFQRIFKKLAELPLRKFLNLSGITNICEKKGKKRQVSIAPGCYQFHLNAFQILSKTKSKKPINFFLHIYQPICSHINQHPKTPADKRCWIVRYSILNRYWIILST